MLKILLLFPQKPSFKILSPYNSYWKNLFDGEQNKSTGKTDIYLKAKTGQGEKIYNLSLKSIRTEYQIASPTYIDIYTILIHAIDVVLEKIKNKISHNLPSDSKELAKIKNEIDDLQKEIKKKKEDGSTSETILKTHLGVTNKKTEKYATVITASILLDIFIHNYVKLNNDLKEFNDIIIDKATLKAKIDNVIGEFKTKYYEPQNDKASLDTIKTE